jgi:hypothetical protein
MRDLLALLIEHGVYSLEKQDLLREYLGDHRWDLDLEQHTVDFGLGRIFRPQILGTMSNSSDTWLWAWANASLPRALVVASQSLHASLAEAGVSILREAEAPLDDLDGHVLGMVASGLLKADGYYLAHHPGGAVLLILADPTLAALRTSDLTHVSSLFTTFISSWEVPDQQSALAAYLRAKGLPLHEEGALVSAHHPDGTDVRGCFDARRLLVKLEITLQGGGAQGRRDA